MDHASRTDYRVLIEHGTGKDGHVLADLRAGHDMNAGVDRRTGADAHLVADGGQGMDVDLLGQFCVLADHGGRADADAPLWSLWPEMGDDRREGPMQLVDQDSR